MSEPERPTLTPLWALWDPPRPNRWLCVPLVVGVALLVASMRLPWHHHVIPAAGYTIIYGIDGASWLLVVAGIAAGFALRLFYNAVGGYVRSFLALLAFVTVLGVYADYVDTQTRAAQLYINAYFGVGFYMALAGTAALVSAAVLTFVLHD